MWAVEGRFPDVPRPVAAGFPVFGLPARTDATRRLGAFEYAGSNLAHITLRHNAGNSWWDITTYTNTARDGLDQGRVDRLEQRLERRLSLPNGAPLPEPASDYLERLIVAGAERDVRFVCYDDVDLAVINLGADSVTIVVERSPQTRSTIRLDAVDDLTVYA